jgi:hypothetical protein
MINVGSKALEEVQEAIVKVLDGQPLQEDHFLYDICETCPWCGADIGARAVIAGAARIYSEAVWITQPYGIDITLTHLGDRLAQHSHVCESPWLP